jgi:hypothetical protein
MISQNSGGDSVWEDEDVCDEVAHSDVVTLELRRKQHAPAVLFAYSPSYVPNRSEPKVSWLAPNALSVDIGRVAEVIVQEERVEGIVVRFRIGSVGSS